MEIYINGKKTEMTMKKGPLVSILEKIEKDRMKKGEVIVELQINGEIVDAKAIPLNKKVKILELKTRTHREIIIESLTLMEKAIDKFYDTYDEVAEGTGEIFKVFEIADFIEWCLGVLMSLKEATKIDMIYIDFDEYLNDFKKYTKEMMDAFKNESIEKALDIIETVFLDLIDGLKQNRKDYLDEVIEEERRKKLLN